MALTPRALGSARTGLRGWLLQRLTAVYIGAFAVYFMLHVAVRAPLDYPAWVALWALPLRIGAALFVGSVLVHSWLGLRSIWMDYLKPIALRMAVSTLTAVFLLFLALWAGRLLLTGFA